MLELAPAGSDAAWDALIEHQPDASLYHTMAWLRLQERLFGFRLFPMVVRQGGEVVGLFPFYLARRAIFRVVSSPRGVDTLFLGPLIRPELLGELFDCYEKWARTHRVDYTAIAFAKGIDSREAASRGYHCKQRRTYLLDLSPGEEEVFRKAHQDCRTEVRKARRLGVKVLECDLRPYVDTYLKWSGQIWGKKGNRTSLTKGFFLGLLEAMAGSGRLLSVRAEVDGQLAGMYIAGHYRKTLYTIDTVSDYRFKKTSSNRLMTWYLVSWACRHGLQTVDFVGANWASIAAYKASFGGVLSPYTNITKAHTPLAREVASLRARVADAGGLARAMRAWAHNAVQPR